MIRFLRKPEHAKAFADLTLEDGKTTIRVPGDAPYVGDPALVLNAQGQPGQPLADGTYQTQNGYVITVAGGRIVAVSLASAQSPADSAGNQAMSSLQAQVSMLSEQLAQLSALPAAEPVVAKPQAERVGQPQSAHFANGPLNGSASRLPHWSSEDVAEGIRMIRLAKQGHPEYRFNRVNAKRFTTGSGVDFNNLLDRCPDIAKDLFHLMVVEEGLAQHFRVLDVNANGGSPMEVELPGLDDTDTAGYLVPGIGCTYPATGQTILSRRSMSVQPWHYYREYCPKEWGNSFRGLAYVNDEQLPYESVILEFLFSKIRNAWERAVMMGQQGVDSPFDGLLTQILADAAIPAGQKQVIVPTGTDAVAQFETLLAAVPGHMYANVLNEPLLWFTPNEHLEFYVKNYRSTFESLPYNNRFEKFGPDSALKQADFVPTAFLTQHHIITPASNLFLGVGKDMQIDVQFHDAGRTQYLFVRVEGHTGVGYPLSQQMVVGTPS